MTGTIHKSNQLPEVRTPARLVLFNAVEIYYYTTPFVYDINALFQYQGTHFFLRERFLRQQMK